MTEARSEDDYLNPEDRKILNFMFDHLDMSPREVAKHFHTSLEHVHDILQRDLKEVLR